MITRKTAILFAAACYGAATLSGEEESRRTILREFGLNLGIAFQMIDDVLDYDGTPETMGKNVGDDLTEGKVTLPLIHTLLHGNAAEQAIVRGAITGKNTAEIEQITAALRALRLAGLYAPTRPPLPRSGAGKIAAATSRQRAQRPGPNH